MLRFSKYGVHSIDADAVYHDLTSAGAMLNQRIAERFGTDVLNTDKSLNRKVLSEIVFSDGTGNLLKELNALTHSSVISETERRIKKLSQNGKKAVIFDAPLLFESGFDKKCDYIITVTADLEDKIKRIMQRDGIDYDKANARINSQLSEQFLKERSNYVIRNSGSLEDIDRQVKEILTKIIKM